MLPGGLALISTVSCRVTVVLNIPFMYSHELQKRKCWEEMVRLSSFGDGPVSFKLYFI